MKDDFERCFRRIAKDSTCILPDNLRNPWLLLDLSANNKGLPTNDLNEFDLVENYIFNKIESAGATAGYGGFFEKRAWYQTSSHFSSGDEARTIHLGVDIWVPPGTAVRSILPAAVHSFQDNNNFLDYGPTIILEHEAEGLKWYALYGHLSRESLVGLREGDRVEAGQTVANVGNRSENGSWIPHLHYQIITDLGDKKGDFAGVSSEAMRSHYQQICLDPALLLNPTIVKDS